MKIRARTVTFLVCFLVWSMLSFSLDWQHLLVGVLLSLAIAAMTGDLFTDNAGKWLDARRYFWFGIFTLLFIWECIKSNIDVAIRVLSPQLPIDPGIVRIKIGLKTETAQTLLANFITLTPGTFSVDIDRQNSYLYIHWIDVKTQDAQEAYEIIASKFERILRRVFE